jgi:hypothetical protein
MRKWMWLGAFLLAISGCASTGQGPAWQVKLDQAPLAGGIEIEGMKVSLAISEAPNPVLFGCISDDSHSDIRPQIIVRLDHQWRQATLRDLQGDEFVYAGYCKPRNEYFAILQFAVEGPGQDLDIIHSTDGGRTWSMLASVTMPHYWAAFAGFRMERNGRGELTVRYDDDNESVPRGYYHYHTADGGRTWHGPQLAADDLTEAYQVEPEKTLKQAMETIDKY